MMIMIVMMTHAELKLVIGYLNRVRSKELPFCRRIITFYRHAQPYASLRLESNRES
jgi:hypothetical protein